jgi:4-hydroxy-tetrahydrodipicolinate reductase
VPDPVLGIVGAGRLGAAIRRRAVADGHTVHVYDPREPAAWRSQPVPGVVLDCSAPPAVGGVADFCRERGLPLVECVSGLGDEQRDRLAELGTRTAVVLAANLSLGNYLQTRALRCVAEAVVMLESAGIRGVVPEAAVLERHPPTKAHRPSTTAVALAREWTRHTGRPVADVASFRSGPAVSDHHVRLVWPEQVLTLGHEVGSLDAAAAGALGAARWAVGRAPGTYPVHQVFDDLLAAGAAGGEVQGHAAEQKGEPR